MMRQVYTLSGSRICYDEVASAFSSSLRRAVTYQQLSSEAVRSIYAEQTSLAGPQLSSLLEWLKAMEEEKGEGAGESGDFEALVRAGVMVIRMMKVMMMAMIVLAVMIMMMMMMMNSVTMMVRG
jgi:hypothetical protein